MMRFLLGLLITMGVIMPSAFPYSGSLPLISITQIADHSALNAVAEGVQAFLKSAGYVESESIAYLIGNAQGNISLANQLAQAHRGQSPQVMVAISTPSAQAALKAARGQIPVVFSAITDPLAANLVNGNPSSFVTGVTDLPPFNQQMAFIKSVVKGLRNIGFIYNPGEDNAVASLKAVEQTLGPLGIQLYPIPVHKMAEVGSSLKAAIGKIEALYVPNDNTVVPAIQSLIKIAVGQKIPVFAADILLVEKGCIGMVGVDYHQIGWQTGRMVEQILKGVPLPSLPAENPNNFKLYLNVTMANQLGLVLPPELVKKADKIF